MYLRRILLPGLPVLVPLALLATFPLMGITGCPPPDNDGDGYTVDGGDCDDSDPGVNPGMAELCDGKDQDCDGQIDASNGAVVFVDRDGDGFGAAIGPACAGDAPRVGARGDCDDTEPAVHPGARDPAGDGIDQDCGGTEGMDPHVGLSQYSLPSIQQALNAAGTGNTIWVGPGSYGEHDLTWSGKALTLASTNLAADTVIDAGRQGRVVTFNHAETSACVLDGFTLTGGYVSATSGTYYNPGDPAYGGGILIDRASPTIIGCIISGNTVQGQVHSSCPDIQVGYGGGLALMSSSASIRDSSISGNTAETGSYTGTICDCDIDCYQGTLSAPSYGGGVYASESTATFTRTVIADNTATAEGGGVSLKNDLGSSFSSCELLRNTAVNGGAVWADFSPFVMSSSVVAGNSINSSQGVAAGIYLNGGSPGATLTNVILAFNAPYNLYAALSTPTLTYSDLYNPPGQPNHNLSPLDPTAPTLEPGFLAYGPDGLPTDLHLAATSPLIDAGAGVDPDGSPADIGLYGGLEAENWDRDRDGQSDYYWPGGFGQVPAGIDASSFDCQDGDPAIRPGALEVQNGLDDDCDGAVDAGVLWFRDSDGDGFGDPQVTATGSARPAGYVADHGDCDDSSAATHPGAIEICDGNDQDCDGQRDEGFAHWFFPDMDGDGFGDEGAEPLEGCGPIHGYAANELDCEDGDAAVNPATNEAPGNGLDDNCDGTVDEHIVVVSAGAYHSLALLSNGRVLAWGWNDSGRLGTGSSAAYLSVPTALPDLTGVVAISAGYDHSLALLEDGTVLAWGDNSYGQLGNGQQTDTNIPGQVPDIDHVVAISAGGSFSMALKSDGTVWGWGRNYYGALGEVTTNTKVILNPVQIGRLPSIASLSAGGGTVMAISTSGDVWGWGYGGTGGLGNGLTLPTVWPPERLPAWGKPRAVDPGSLYSLVLSTDGTVLASGGNDNGQLGNGTTVSSLTPVAVSGLTGVTMIDAGWGDHGLAVDSSGAAWAWGDNTYGQLGDGTTSNDRTSPKQVAGLAPAGQVSAGRDFSLGLTSSSQIWAWGANEGGELGTGDTTQSAVPVQAKPAW